MGMFDTVRSSYPLLGEELDLELQTKDLDCLLHHCWLSPADELQVVRAARSTVVVPGQAVAVADGAVEADHGVVRMGARRC